jgi:hypothetical protein
MIPRAPVTENPVVSSLVRAMQKSGLPIAERPNLLLKGSGRVNRILGPEEELTDTAGEEPKTSEKTEGALMPRTSTWGPSARHGVLNFPLPLLPDPAEVNQQFLIRHFERRNRQHPPRKEPF